MLDRYDNYIFDLYGTLVDIHTDEEEPLLWARMAGKLKAEYEADYEGKELKESYSKACRAEEDRLREKNNAEYPEIKIENVWAKLISDKTGRRIEPDALRPLCVFFRESSRDRLEKFEGTDRLLSMLKESGRKVFLLSNAQRFFTEKELEDTHLTAYFDDVFISSDIGIKKPQKEFLEKLIKKNSLNPAKCVMIGNEIFSDGGVARKNGIDSIIVENGDFSKII